MIEILELFTFDLLPAIFRVFRAVGRGGIGIFGKLTALG